MGLEMTLTIIKILLIVAVITLALGISIVIGLDHRELNRHLNELVKRRKSRGGN